MSKIAKSMAVLGVVAGLGVAALPLASYAATVTDNADVTVRAKVNNTITLAVDENLVDLGTLVVNGDAKTGSVKATVSTTSTSGYKLTIMGKDGDTDMHVVDGTGTPLAGGAIIATGTVLSGSTSAWAYKVGGNGWTAIPTTATEIAKSDTAITDPAETEITFGVYAGGTQAEGTYEGNVTLTATAETD